MRLYKNRETVNKGNCSKAVPTIHEHSTLKSSSCSVSINKSQSLKGFKFKEVLVNQCVNCKRGGAYTFT